MNAIVSLQGVEKRFGGFTALRGVSGDVLRGETIVVCGSSGSGKSTLIRTLNGLERIDAGRILIEGLDISSKKANLPLLRRRVGFVFQEFNLFPHLTAVENVSLGARKLLRMPDAAARAMAARLLDRVGLAHRCDYFPADLSGGEKQRVAIARALSMDPFLLLLDEPTSALDPEAVGGVLEIVRALARNGMTMVCVTHEMGFAREAASWVWFMEAGSIVEKARPDDFFMHPAHASARRFVASIGSARGTAETAAGLSADASNSNDLQSAPERNGPR